MPDVPNSELRRILKRWGISGIAGIARPALGTMNDTWFVQHQNGKVVLRRHRFDSPAPVEFEHRVIAYAGEHGIPVPEVFPAIEGTTVVRENGFFHSLYSWERGEHVRRGSFNQVHAHAFGKMLAVLHKCLADFEGGVTDDPPIPTKGETLAKAQMILDMAKRKGKDGRFQWIIENIENRLRWIDLTEAPPSEWEHQIQLIHGDYQDTNVLSEGDSITAVLDWDRSRRASPELEVVRALHHGLLLNSPACKAFLHGYREVRALTRSAFNSAVEQFTYRQVHGMWIFEQLVLHDDRRMGSLAIPEDFVPFDQRWAPLGIV